MAVDVNYGVIGHVQADFTQWRDYTLLAQDLSSREVVEDTNYPNKLRSTVPCSKPKALPPRFFTSNCSSVLV